MPIIMGKLVPFYQLEGKINLTRKIETKDILEKHYMDEKGNIAITFINKKAKIC